jgi:signal peptidase II
LKLDRKHWVILLVTPLAILIDQLSKFYVHAHLRLFDEHALIPDYFNIVYVQNRGLAFGLFQQRIGSFSTWIFLGITVVAMGIIVHLFFSTDKKAVVLPLALSLVMSGALGNLIDRMHWGFVVDFMQMYFKGHYWPTFNVADIAITAGIILLILDSFRAQPETKMDTAAAGPEKKGAPGAA